MLPNKSTKTQLRTTVANIHLLEAAFACQAWIDVSRYPPRRLQSTYLLDADDYVPSMSSPLTSRFINVHYTPAITRKISLPCSYWVVQMVSQ